MRNKYKDIIQEEIVNELYDTFSDQTYNHLKYYALKRGRYDLLKKLNDYDRSNSDFSERDDDREWHSHKSFSSVPLKNKLNKFVHPNGMVGKFLSKFSNSSMDNAHKDMETDIYGDRLNSAYNGLKTPKKGLAYKDEKERNTTPPRIIDRIEAQDKVENQSTTSRFSTNLFYKWQLKNKAKKVALDIKNGKRKNPTKSQRAIMQYGEYFEPENRSELDILINQELAKLC